MDGAPPRFLLVGPYDPHCGEYTFLAPPLGVWRLKGVLDHAGVRAEVFDPNCCDDGVSPEEAFERVLRRERWDVVGVSTTGMTLRFDLALAHQARRALPDAVLVAGGMEATFRPDLMFRMGPFDLVALGEGERPLLEIAERLEMGAGLEGVVGTALPRPGGDVVRLHQIALDHTEHRDAVFRTPYHEMPYASYWRRLEEAYRVHALPMKADREARLAEVRSVRLITLNYCPMGCTFCSSTNFLNEAQDAVARIRRLDAEEIYTMVRRIVGTLPDVRTVIFQDDIFVFTNDDRILPLCAMLQEGKTSGELPPDLQFISTNRIDAMTPERLDAMHATGFRVLGFGVESFSPDILVEFNKGRIYPHIEPNLTHALELGITPFLDLILTSPRCSIDGLARTIREGYRWLVAGCEMGMYPYVIPFSGAALARDPDLVEHTVSEHRRIRGTDLGWDQPAKILPVDPHVRSAILAMEEHQEAWLELLHPRVPHLPSRLRSMLWILSAAPVLGPLGLDVPDAEDVLPHLLSRLPAMDDGFREEVTEFAHGHAAAPAA